MSRVMHRKRICTEILFLKKKKRAGGEREREREREREID